MRILGISGSLNPAHEHTDGDHHDAAAVLVEDGMVVAAIEEERLNRIKHTDKFPVNSIKFVLDQQNLGLGDLDQICYYSINNYYFAGEQSIPTTERIQALLTETFGDKIDKDKIYLVHHHLAHAVSSFYMSGFDKSLVLSIDGQGDGLSGLLLKGEGKTLERLQAFSIEDSLGIYYLNVIDVLGYKQFDEYKVMGLAPYGNADTYRDLFKSFYTLLPEGGYQIHLKQVKKVYLLTPRRKKDEPFTQVHKDIAAALQESLEEIVTHILTHYQKKFGYRKLCLVGGVSHNCTMNGKIMYSGLFEDVFVQPAAHDAGCALGAALYRYHQLNPQHSFTPLQHLYWGSPLETDDSILQVLDSWNNFLVYEKIENITAKTAQLLADGAVIGWVQGRSEFGPRALGNRSIIGDPRPAKNKDIINEMVKKREAYRPFAPSVLEEYLHDYYDVPSTIDFSYMIFVVKVKEDKQHTLGAVTHVDFTARIQTVSKKTNPTYWELINAFYKITGIPILLNTSFNNNAEPIVDSTTDAVVCFLTTQLNYLVVGNYLVKKKEVLPTSYLALVPSIPVHNVLTLTHRFISARESTKCHEIKNNFDNGYQNSISPETFHVLNESNGHIPLSDLMKNVAIKDDGHKEQLINEILELWKKRFIRMKPTEKNKRSL